MLVDQLAVAPGAGGPLAGPVGPVGPIGSEGGVVPPPPRPHDVARAAGSRARPRSAALGQTEGSLGPLDRVFKRQRAAPSTGAAGSLGDDPAPMRASALRAHDGSLGPLGPPEGGAAAAGGPLAAPPSALASAAGCAAQGAPPASAPGMFGAC